MSVSSHLGIDLAEYDRRIRSFIPRYEELLGAAAAALAGLPAGATLLELGVGTGALARRCLMVAPDARLVGIDADAEILAVARRRLGRVAAKATFLTGNFARVPLPACDAIVASLALHHVRTRRAKQRLYARCFEALAPGGLLVNADCQPPVDARLARQAREAWHQHMRASYTAAQVDAYFRAWADEDVYFPLRDEQAMLAEAGFVVDVAWRAGAFAVTVARRP